MGNGAEPDDTCELSAVDLVLLGARIYYLVRRGATLRELLHLVANTGNFDHAYYLNAVRRVLDDDGIDLVDPNLE